MLLDTIFKKLPDGVLCRELKLLYVSGRLFEAFQMRDINKMPLTTIEKMFLKWAMRQWKKSEDAKKYAHNREEFKHWATKLAITGRDEVIESGVINSNPYIPYIPRTKSGVEDPAGYQKQWDSIKVLSPRPS